MTTQHQTIAFCVLAVISVPVGTFYSIKLIKRLWSPPVNTLTRRGDIELNYIEPGQSYNYPDLLESPAPIYDRIQSYPPSYRSGTLPSYYTNDGRLINCCLEDNINLDYILWLI